ncbi:MAG: branched-chain amino acid ABC transporter permease [Lachnospiraceae bacterium]|nr:branched-chain amino acid ABC transporter permease [Lachnospiraceae bacterium]
MSTFFQLIFSGLETGSIYALAALGIIIIFRTSRTTNFAQGAIGMFNCYVATVTLINLEVPVWVAVLVGMLTAFATGVFVDLVIIRRAQKVSSVAKQIITFGIIMIFTGLAPIIFGTMPLSFPRFILQGSLDLFGASISYNGLLNIAIGLLIMGVLFYFLQHTKWGLAVRVTASNDATARLMGVPTSMVTMGAWAIAAALGTLAAIMHAPNISVGVNMMENVQVNAFIAIVFGGFQSFHGPVIAAYIIGLSRNLLLFYGSSTWGEPILYGLILLFIVFRPNGLIGKKIVKKV